MLYGGSAAQLVSQIVGLGSVLLFVGLTTGMLFLVLNSLGWLRVSAEEEITGLDLAEHATPAYNDDFVDYDAFEDAPLGGAFDDVFDDLGV